MELHTTKLAVPIQWWRSVGSTHTAFSTECFLDEIARGTKQDPYAIRRALLSDKHTRHKAVLELVANKSGWSKPRGKDEVWGLAVHESFNTVVGQVAQLGAPRTVQAREGDLCRRLRARGNPKHRHDADGIGHRLRTRCGAERRNHAEGRQIEQGNFDDYSVLRMNQMPAIDVHILPSTNKPSGVGEPGTPVIAPALANALATANGNSIRTLPLAGQGITLV